MVTNQHRFISPLFQHHLLVAGCLLIPSMLITSPSALAQAFSAGGNDQSGSHLLADGGIGRSEWQQPSASSTGQSDWQQPSSSSTGQSDWQQPSSSSTGQSDWHQPSSSSVGQSDWQQPSSSSTGQSDWHQPSSSSTGQSDWHQPSSSSVGQSDWQRPPSTSSTGQSDWQHPSASSTGQSDWQAPASSRPSSPQAIKQQPSRSASNSGQSNWQSAPGLAERPSAPLQGEVQAHGTPTLGDVMSAQGGGTAMPGTAVSVPIGSSMPAATPNFGASASSMPDPAALLNTPFNQMTPAQMLEVGAGAMNLIQNAMPGPAMGAGGFPARGGFGNYASPPRRNNSTSSSITAPIKRTVNRTVNTVENAADAGIYYGVRRAVNQAMYNSVLNNWHF